MYKDLLRAVSLLVIFQASISTGNAATVGQIKEKIGEAISGNTSKSKTPFENCKEDCDQGKTALTKVLNTKRPTSDNITALCQNNPFCKKFPGKDKGESCQETCQSTLQEIVAEDFTALERNIETMHKSCNSYCENTYPVSSRK